MERKLTTVLCADVVGYSKLMGSNEELTLEILTECRSIIDPLIKQYNGRIFNTAGDAVLAEFANPTDCVTFAFNCQTALHARNQRNSNQPAMRFRMGIHSGSVAVHGNDLLGDTINIGARIESQADLGGISLSHAVYEQVQDQLPFQFEDRGQQNFKNIKDPVKVWAIKIQGSEANPNAAKESDKTAERHSDKGKSTAEILAEIRSDTNFVNATMRQAMQYKAQKDFDKAIRAIFKCILKKEKDSIDELFEITANKHVPTNLKPYVSAMIEATAKQAKNHENIALVAQLHHSGFFGDYRRWAGAVLYNIAAAEDQNSRIHFAEIIFAKSYASDDEKNRACFLLELAARKRSIKAALMLGRYHKENKNNKLAFLWLWVARSKQDQMAQLILESLVKDISKNDFATWQIEANALVQDIFT